MSKKIFFDQMMAKKKKFKHHDLRKKKEQATPRKKFFFQPWASSEIFFSTMDILGKESKWKISARAPPPRSLIVRP